MIDLWKLLIIACEGEKLTQLSMLPWMCWSLSQNVGGALWVAISGKGPKDLFVYYYQVLLDAYLMPFLS